MLQKDIPISIMPEAFAYGGILEKVLSYKCKPFPNNFTEYMGSNNKNWLLKDPNVNKHPQATYFSGLFNP